MKNDIALLDQAAAAAMATINALQTGQMDATTGFAIGVNAHAVCRAEAVKLAALTSGTATPALGNLPQPQTHLQ